MMTLLAFAITIVVIVAFHEWGHFLAMRLFGVRVLVFSVGFGPKLLRWKDKRGTEWALSAIPLGGYVKPLSSREFPDAKGEPGDIEDKSAWQRIVVYAAGPIFNFILAALIYWGLLVANGSTDLEPVVGPVNKNSIASEAGFLAGDRILSVEGMQISGWREFDETLLDYVGERVMPVTVQTVSGDTVQRFYDVSQLSDPSMQGLAELGLSKGALLGDLTPDGAAEQAGLQPGDLLIAANGEPVASWGQWVELVRGSPALELQVTVLRAGESLTLPVTPDTFKGEDGEAIGRIGVGLGGVLREKIGLVDGLFEAQYRTQEMITAIVTGLYQLITGQLSSDNLGGPITIAKVAGESAAVGASSLLLVIAYLSITLGVINLIPLPILDGGWIFLGIIEMIRGRKLSEPFLVAWQGVGFVLILGIMMLAIFNDVVKQIS